MIIPFRWIFAAVLAAAVHELSHIAAIRITGGQVTGVYIGILCAKIETVSMSCYREALCAAAGPLGSLILSFTVSSFPEAAVCAAVQGAYNLLPIYPLDGGRILYTLLPKAVCAGIEIFAEVLLLGIGIWGSLTWDIGILPLFPGIFAAAKGLERKIPCKEVKQAVQ